VLRRLGRTLALVVPVVILALPMPATAGPRGVFVAECRYSHSLRDDPIMLPGQPGASHRHDFFGNGSTDADSTVRSMLRAGTTCSLRADTAGYWFPTGYLDGVRLVPTFAKVYYFGRVGRRVEPPPRGLEVVGGDPASASSADNPHVTWSCGASGTRRSPIVDHPYDCTRLAKRWNFVDSIVARVELPSCWDGDGRAPDDVAYAVGGRCPAGFGHRLTTLHMQVHYGVLDPCRPSAWCSAASDGRNVTLTLSSGPYSTFHADLWNTWHQSALERLVRRCLDRHVVCGTVADR
jgi:uncharacterized protein DUF1996